MNRTQVVWDRNDWDFEESKIRILRISKSGSYVNGNRHSPPTRQSVYDDLSYFPLEREFFNPTLDFVC